MLAIGMVQLDLHLINGWTAEHPWLLTTPDGARSMLATIAGSMITVAGVTFSMTLLAISHASSQIGPRLLTGFMEDRANQLTLGAYIATFLYSMLVLRSVQAGESSGNAQAVSDFVPHLSVLVGMFLAITNVMVLIYFIHHVTRSINIANVIHRVGSELIDCMGQIYPERLGESKADVDDGHLPKDYDEDSRALLRKQDIAGYLRVMDAQQLLELATEHELVVELHARPGDYRVASQPLMSVWPAETLEDEELQEQLIGCCAWGEERNSNQDLLYPVEQLTEIMGRALSPGVNNQYVALLCINQFERSLAYLLARDLPGPNRVDEEGVVRVLVEPVTYVEFLDAMILPSAQFARGDWLSCYHLLQMLKRLRAMPELADSDELLHERSRLIMEESWESNMSRAEKHQLRELSGERIT